MCALLSGLYIGDGHEGDGGVGGGGGLPKEGKKCVFNLLVFLGIFIHMFMENVPHIRPPASRCFC